MKDKLAVFIGLFLLMVLGVLGNKTVAKAAGDYTNPELKITRVEDITVYNEYFNTINTIVIDNSTTQNQDGWQVYKITLEKDGYVTLLLTCRKVDKFTQKSGSDYGASSTEASLSATIYRDSGLLYPVSPAITAKGNIKGESTQKIALDQGTYYIAVQTDKYTSSSSKGTTTTVFVYGKAELIVYYQPVDSYESYRPSLAGKENLVVMEESLKGLLTVTNPKDYYKFELKDKALVKINFMYSSKNPAKFTLYSTEREELLTKTVSGNNVWYNVEKYLEPGTYYFSVETTKLYDGGSTNVLINQTIYPLDLAQVNQAQNTYVTVATIDDPKEIKFVLGKLTNSELTVAKWNNGKVITDTLQFGVNKTGYYTVRVTDQYGNMFMQTIKILQCDKKPPKLPTINTYLVDTFVISGTAEQNAFITVYVNGKAYTCTANELGKYKCTLPSKLIKGSVIEVTAQDISGNISEKAETMIE